ncbi:hypothetical protein [Variovorax guangxiensis]|uniref:hypothetical protein n=1 Tax=Variovorax guangxiensis TaxID=1775474 RepID=UPI00285E09CD|nr:hypothetical protein [Variovorax guangxiensis]MDR6854171.1 hypothetical protein [Variovorax guangxiensis]
MQKMTMTLVAAAILATAAFLIFQQSKNTQMADALGHSGSTSKVLSPPSGGAAEYKAKIALAASKIDDQHPLRLYKPRPGIEGRNAMDEIYFQGVPATAQLVSLARTLLHSGTLSPDEKIPLLRILTRLYDRANTTGVNADIASELKNFAFDQDKQVAAQAAVNYARQVEYQPGTELVLVLKKVLENGTLDASAYYQELAHLIPSSPPEKQKEFLAEIRAAGSLIGRDVLVMALNSGEEFNAVSFLKSSEDMAELLRETEPTFGPLVGLGLGQAVRYTEWLRASAAIESHKTGRSIDEVIIARLSQPNTDERKVMGFLLSPQAGPMLAAAAPDSPVQKLVAVAQVYSAQSPGNLTMIEFVKAIRGRMKHPPPPLPPIVAMPPTGPLPGPSPAPPGYPMYVPPAQR